MSSSPTNHSFFDKARIYVTGTYKLPLISTHVAPPLHWTDAAKLDVDLGIKFARKPELPNTSGFNEAQLYDTYAGYVQKNGSQKAKDALECGDQVIVGLRVPTNTRINQGQGAYDDRIAVIWKEIVKQPPLPAGVKPPPAIITKHGADYIANTEPSAQYEDPGKEWIAVKDPKTTKLKRARVPKKIIDPDGNEVITKPQDKWEGTSMNGRKALGSLVPGTYTFHFADGEKFGLKYLRGTTDQVVSRDVNHDGNFTEQDVWRTDKGDTVLETGDFAILFHKGGDDNTWSAGCQTMPKAKFSLFIDKLRKLKKASFTSW